MPDAIEVPLDALEIGHAVRVADITLPGLTILNAENNTVISVQVTRAAVASAEDAAKAAAPAKGAAPAKTAAAPAKTAAAPAKAAAKK